MRRGAYTWIAGGLALLGLASPAPGQDVEPPALSLPAPTLEPAVEAREPLDDGWVAAEKRESSPDSSPEAFLPPVAGVVTARSATPLSVQTRNINSSQAGVPRLQQGTRIASSRPSSTLSSPITMRLARLRVESQTSYERSLLPLADHLENLALAEVAALSQLPVNADAQPWPEVDSAALLRALEPRLRELRRTVEVLERFRQPAAVGYNADLALARYALADASLNAAWLTGEMSAVPRLTAETQRQARQRYHQLVFDYQVLGTASLPELADSIALQTISPRLETQLRGSVTQQTERWQKDGAGIGRPDRLSRARLQQVVSRAQLARLQEQPEELAQQLIRADEMLLESAFQIEVENGALGEFSVAWAAAKAEGWRIDTASPGLFDLTAVESESALSTGVLPIRLRTPATGKLEVRLRFRQVLRTHHADDELLLLQCGDEQHPDAHEQRVHEDRQAEDEEQRAAVPQLVPDLAGGDQTDDGPAHESTWN